MSPAEFPALERDGYAGKKLGRFEVMAKLGVGGMSEVYLAWQKAVGGFQRPVVLKRILETVRRNQEFLRMFVKEAKITSALNHSGIAHLYELVHEGDDLFMVMEFVPGATLVEVARACHLAHEPIPIGFTTSVVKETALALHYAHTFTDPGGRTRPVIHRDVAEKNIMVGLDGASKLLDFGIARQTDGPGMTQVGTVKGTAGYMSPEQVKGDKLDGRTDVFSLGVVLHECLTGQRLFRRNTVTEEVQALLESEIHLPSSRNRDVSAELDGVVMKALERDRTRRFSSAKEMAQALEAAAGQEMWTQQQRAEFIQRHFAVRQRDILALIGDPAATDLGELLSDDESAPGSRDDVRPAGRPIEDERTLEVRGITGRGSEPRPVLGQRVSARVTGEAPRRPVPAAATPTPSGPFAGDDRTHTEPPQLPIEPRTVTQGTGAPALRIRRESPTVATRPARSIEPVSTESPAVPLTGENTVVGAETFSQAETEEAGPEHALQPGRRRQQNLARQKQALLMWIAIGSGVVLGLVLAAFLIWGGN